MQFRGVHLIRARDGHILTGDSESAFLAEVVAVAREFNVGEKNAFADEEVTAEIDPNLLDHLRAATAVELKP